MAFNLQDYDTVYRSFQWSGVRNKLSGLPGGKGFNIACEAVDRHAAGPLKNTVALRWLRKDKSVEEATYADLQRRTAQFANVLEQLGVTKGDAVFSFAGRIPELYIAALGTLKKRPFFAPFSRFSAPSPCGSA